MAFNFLKEENLAHKFSSAKLYTESLTEPFPEFDRIARNVPHKGKDPRYPNTTDGTTAATIRKLGKRVVQQLPTGIIESDDEDDWLPIVAGFVYTHKILPFANLEYDLIQKCWQVIERGGTFGATATYTPFVSHDGYFCPDLVLPYWGDVFIQPGKKSGYDCEYVFIRSWWQEDDISALIDGEKKRAKDAKDRGEKYDSSWDLPALEKAKNMSTHKDEKAKTPHETDRNVDADGIPVITGFQKGVGATFFTFLIGGDKDEVTIVRRKKNKDPRGKYPIDWYYHDTDGANPLGRGIVELIGGLQNLIDSDMQMYQFNRALMLAPPIIKRGNFSKKKIVYAPNAIIDVGTDPAADVKALDVDTSAVINYPALYGLQKSQLLNLVSSPDTSIGSDIGNPGFGKTPTAINTQKSIMSVDDNFVRKMFEAWFEHWSETAVNLYFAERSGIEELQLDGETVLKLKELAERGRFDLNLLSPDNKLMIDYDTATPALKFRVDASSSKVEDDAQQLQLIQEALKTVTPQVSYYMGQDGWKFNLGEAYRTMLSKFGIENIDKVITKMSDEEAQQAKTAPFPIIDPPQIRLTGQIPPGAMAGALQNGGVQVTADQASNDQPIDMGDIYKGTTDPSVKAQIEQMAGLTPDPANTASNIVTNHTQHLANQVNNVVSASQPTVQPLPQDNEQAEPNDSPKEDLSEENEPAEPNDSASEDAVEQQIVAYLQNMNVPQNLIQEAIQMADSGYSADEIISAIQGVLQHA